MTPYDLPAGAVLPDVAFHNGTPCVVYQVEDRVCLERVGGGGKDEYSCPGQLAFPRLLAYLGHLWLAFKGTGGIVRVAVDGTVRALEPGWGNDPLCLGVVGGLPYVYVQTSRQTVKRWPLTAEGVGAAETVSATPAPTGFSHVTPAGVVVTVDKARLSVPGMTRPCVVGEYVVGEAPDAGAILQTRDGTRRLLLWGGALAKTPRLAVDGNRLLVAKWQPGRVALVAANELTTAPIVTPPKPPPPEPPPPPKEPTVSLPDYSAYVTKRCRELGLKRVDGGNNDATRERSFTILNQIAAELHATDPRIGLLEKTGGNRWRDRAIDILTCLQPSGVCEHFDVLADAEGADGDPRPAWRYVGPINASRWKEPYPVESLPEPPPPPKPEPEPEPEPEPGPEPTDPDDDLKPELEAIAQLLDAVADKLADHAASVDAANARLDKIEAALIAVLSESRKPRPVTLNARILGTVTGTIGAPQA